MLFIIALLLVSSCVQSPVSSVTPSPTYNLDPDMIDRSWLTGTPCRLPCWYGLEPGKTTKTETISIVKQLNFIDLNRIDEAEMYYGLDHDYSTPAILATFIPLFCKEPDDTECARIAFEENDVLLEVLIIPNYYVNFGNFVELYGEPSFIEYRYLDPGSTARCYVSPIWHQESMAISYLEIYEFSGRDLCKTMDDNGHKTFEDLPVEYIILSLPGYYREEYMRSSPVIHEWTGFVE